MLTVAEIIEKLGGAAAVARWLKVGASTVSEQKRRGNIPGEYWVQLVAGAHAAGHTWLTYKYLALVHAEKNDRLVLSEIPEPAPAELAPDLAVA